MYGNYETSNYAAAHTNTNDSTIKTYIDNWYKTNILNTTDEEYLADNIFCNDRSLSTANIGNEVGTTKTFYRWYYGPWDSGNYNDDTKLICPQQNDAFTVDDTTYGNGALTYPIGLLTTDEVVLTGGWNDANSNYYLYTGQSWWSISPGYFNNSLANGRHVYWNGSAYNYYVLGDSYGVRPVLNLKPEALKYGDGTANNPYRLTE